MAIVEIDKLTYFYPKAEHPALRDITMEIKPGEIVLITGGSGSGKSTLIKAIAGLVPAFYGGSIKGRVLFKGTDIRHMDKRALARKIGCVFQEPDNQLVLGRVDSEIAFGLENIGLEVGLMNRRIAEALNLLKITNLKEKQVSELSGGEKQKVALASVMSMRPELLLMDEPTSNLDPMATDDLMNTIRRLNDDLGLTVVMVLQDTADFMHKADKVLLMADGEISLFDEPKRFAGFVLKKASEMLPPAAKLLSPAEPSNIPLTVKEARKAVIKTALRDVKPKTIGEIPKQLKDIIKIENVSYSYPNTAKSTLKNVNINVGEGEFLAILGENGAGKSTLLKVMASLIRPEKGRISLKGLDVLKTPQHEIAKVVGYMPQNSWSYLFNETVEDELIFTQRQLNAKNDALREKLLTALDLQVYRRKNPRDLSGGERQRVALASVLAAGQQVLLLDEPTRGLDAYRKQYIGEILTTLNKQGITVVLVTHDMDFAAEYASSVAIMFDSTMLVKDDKYKVMDGSLYFSPQVNRVFNGLCRGVITMKDAKEALGM
jgi:energy-coupling factor transporter ATP-binding protein EcfA2